MEDIKNLAHAAKQRLKNNFWEDCKKNFESNASQAKAMGLNEDKVRTKLHTRVQSEIKGEKEDGFYLKVKALLDSEGEVSDAIGRLTDREYYETLTYEEKQRYNLTLSSKYLRALEKYRKEKELGI